MRLTTSALTAAVLGTAVSATTLIAQQTPPDSGLGTTTASIPGMSASRGARYLLRNGWDYLKYQEYERALKFFREAETRKSELNPSEQQALVQGIDNARRGMREAGDGSAGRSYAGRGPIHRPGSFALAKPTQPAPSAPAAEPIQLTSGARPTDQPAPASDPGLPPLPSSEAASTPELSLPPLPGAVATASPDTLAPPPAIPGPPAAIDSEMTRTHGTSASLTEPASEPLSAPESLSPPPAIPEPRALAAESAATPPASDLAPLEFDSVALPPLSSSPSAEPAAPPEPTAAPAPEPLPSAPAQEAPSALAPSASEPPLPVSEPPAPAPVEAPAAAPAMPEALPELPRVATRPEAEAEPTEPPSSIPAAAVETEDPPPPLPAESYPPSTGQEQPRAAVSDSLIPERAADIPSSLSPKLQREVEQLAQQQEEELRARGLPDRAVPGGLTGEVGGMSPSAGLPAPRLEISRAPSPTEARPIRAISVPDEFVPLPKRTWDPQRKYWSASAVCHMPLYFQDAALERYGQSAEQAVGPLGRYLSYPVDDPKQSIQRNQLVQPFASIGLFAFQIGMLPYNLIMDPPWEAEYDLGYYRPGDRIPPDTYYLPLTGVGPPLHGKRY